MDYRDLIAPKILIFNTIFVLTDGKKVSEQTSMHFNFIGPDADTYKLFLLKYWDGFEPASQRTDVTI